MLVLVLVLVEVLELVEVVEEVEVEVVEVGVVDDVEVVELVEVVDDVEVVEDVEVVDTTASTVSRTASLPPGDKVAEMTPKSGPSGEPSMSPVAMLKLLVGSQETSADSRLPTKAKSNWPVPES